VQYRRNFQPGGTYFFTLVTADRHHLFANPDAIALLQTVVREVKTERPFRSEAWVILPDHLHMIWTLPPRDADYSGRWSKIKSQFTRRWLASGGAEREVSIGKQRDRRRGVWQPKFYEHTIDSDDEFIEHVEYVHYNPIKHGYVTRPIDWLHSSFHAYVKRGVYPPTWACGPGDASRHLQDLPYNGGE